MKFSRAAGGDARSLAALVALLALVATAACAHPGPGTEPAPDGSLFPAPGRAVASPLLETRADERSRDRDGEAERVIDALRLVPGMRVADLRSGSGYYAMRLAARLGPASLIYAEDFDPAALALLGVRADRERLLNVIPVQGLANDPQLAPGGVDVALIGHVYHQISSPYEFLYRLAGALAPAGRVAVVGFDRFRITDGVAPSLLECEFRAVGYRRVDFFMLTPGEAYLAVFEPPDNLPRPQDIVPCTQP
jgi:ubiquinone/menaquinone biosynthesis C-methylase UbiE